MPDIAAIMIRPEEAGSYIIFTDGTNFYAKNGLTGRIDFQGTDAASVIQAAIDALTKGGTIYLKEGLYPISKTINITNNGVRIVGAGAPPFQEPLNTNTIPAHGTVLYPTSDFTQGNYIFQSVDTTHGRTGVEIRNIMIYGKDPSGTTRANAIYAQNNYHLTIENVDVFYAYSDAIDLEPYGAGGDSNNVINCVLMNIGGVAVKDWVYESKVIGVEVLNAKWGIDANHNVMVIGCTVDSALQYAFLVRDACTLVGSQIFANSGYNNVFVSGSYITVVGNYLINAGNAGTGGANAASIQLSAAQNVVIAGNVVLTNNNKTSYFLYQGTSGLSSGTILVIGNKFIGTPTSGLYYDASPGSMVMIGNQGLNPLPASTVSIAANSTTTIGPYPYPVYVILSAPGNATSVSLTRSGTSTSLPVQSSYFLYPGDSLSVTEGATAQTAYIVPL